MNMRSALAIATAVRWQVLKAALAAVAVAALAASTGGSAQASTAGQAGGARAVAASPARHSGLRAILYGLSCKGRSFCMALGSSRKPGHPAVQLVEEWNGKKWRTVPGPLTGDLTTITCGSPTFCVAARSRVGRPGGLPRVDLVAWTGRTWRTMKHQPANPRGVTCLSRTLCMDLDGTQIQGWNGSQWQDIAGTDACKQGPPFGPCGWNGFTCGTGTSCIGTFYACSTDNCAPGPDTFGAAFTAAAGWNLFTHVPFIPGGVGCAGRAFCMIASGTAAQVTRDVLGGSWQDATPDLAAVCHGAANCTLNSADLSCGYPGICMALPQSPVVTLAWNSTTWTAVPLAPVHGQVPQLTSMSCGSARNCIAIGSYKRTRWSFRLTAAEHWNGTAWQVTPTPNT